MLRSLSSVWPIAATLAGPSASTASAASLGASVGAAASAMVGSSTSSPSSIHPARVPVCHHLSASSPGLPRERPLASGNTAWRLGAGGQASHMYYLWGVQLVSKASCHGFVAGLCEVDWVSTEEFE